MLNSCRQLLRAFFIFQMHVYYKTLFRVPHILFHEIHITPINTSLLWLWILRFGTLAHGIVEDPNNSCESAFESLIEKLILEWDQGEIRTKQSGTFRWGNLWRSNYFYLRDSGVASKFMRESARIYGVVRKDIRFSFHASHAAAEG